MSLVDRDDPLFAYHPVPTIWELALVSPIVHVYATTIVRQGGDPTSADNLIRLCALLVDFTDTMSKIVGDGHMQGIKGIRRPR